jgi:hypothetical protein
MAQGGGMVMNENTDELPPGCDRINGWENITIRAGLHQAEQFPGTVFTYDDRSYRFDPCTKVSVTFVNNDSVRHQWMVHGLPMDVYDMGMFSIGVTGPGQDTGTFILPNETETLLVHCGLPQHEQKGMKAQLKIGGGDGNIGNIPRITGSYDRYRYPRESPWTVGILLGFIGTLVAMVCVIGYRHLTRDNTPAGSAN